MRFIRIVQPHHRAQRRAVRKVGIQRNPGNGLTSVCHGQVLFMVGIAYKGRQPNKARSECEWIAHPQRRIERVAIICAVIRAGKFKGSVVLQVV